MISLCPIRSRNVPVLTVRRRHRQAQTASTSRITRPAARCGLVATAVRLRMAHSQVVSNATKCCIWQIPNRGNVRRQRKASRSGPRTFLPCLSAIGAAFCALTATGDACARPILASRDFRPRRARRQASVKPRQPLAGWLAACQGRSSMPS